MTKYSKAFQRKIDAYCELRLTTAFSSEEAEALKAYMRRLIERRCRPPRTGGRTEWDVVARLTGIDAKLLASNHRSIDPGFDAIVRWIRDNDKAVEAVPASSRERAVPARPRKTGLKKIEPAIKSAPSEPGRQQLASATFKPATNLEFPEPSFHEWDDRIAFAEALQLHMRRHGETYWVLYRSIVRPDEPMDKNTLLS